MTTRSTQLTKIFSLALSLLIFQCAEDTPTDTPVTYTVTFNANGGSAVESLTVNKDAKADKPADPTRDGYTFVGWYSDQATTTAYDFNTPVTANVTLYAKWTAVETFTIAFNANGGSAVESLTINKDAKADKPADPTRDGYTFVGWYSDQATTTAYDFNTPVTANVTLYAKWTVKKLVQIPDANFRAALQALIGDAFEGDLLDSAHSSVLTLDSLDVHGKSIASLEGIEHFTTLTVLYCQDNNNLSSLDLSRNTALTVLACWNNSLSSVDLSSNTALTGLYCPSNNLSSLDLSSNTALTELVCQDNQLTSLDLRGIKSLTLLRIDAGTAKNAITQLNVHTALQTHGEIREAKTNRGAAITISTYNDANALVCTDFDPTKSIVGTCQD